MKIDKNKQLQEYIYSLNDTNELNMSLADLFLSIIGNNEISSEEELELLSKKFNRSKDDIFLEKITDYLDIDLSIEDNEIVFENFIKNKIHHIGDGKYVNNPYYQSIKIKDIKHKDYSLVIDHYFPYELFALKDIKVNKDYIEESDIAYFDKEFSFIALNHKDVTWMSVTPNEIETMEKGINDAHGDIIVFGLGIGYFAFMVALKEEVKSVTIIEKDADIVALFNKYLYPNFKNKEKIKVLTMDAYDAINSCDKYDFAFVDLWHNPVDGLEIYLDFKKEEKKFQNCQFDYWLEDSFYAYLRRAMIILLNEQLEGFNDKNYKHPETFFDEVINKYYYNTKNLQIHTQADIEDLLSDDKLLALIL